MIGGLSLRVEGRGDLADRLVPALAHHPPSSGAPDLTIRVWDLGVAEFRPFARAPKIAEVFQVHGDHDLGATTEVRCRYDWSQRALQVWDAGTRTAYWVADEPESVTWWEEAAPFRPVLAWWLTSMGRYFAHGAALAVDGKAVLLVGPGGSGKSTTALRAHRAGLGFLGDDYCLVGRAETGIVEHAASGHGVASLYRTVKLRPVDEDGGESELAHHEGGRKVVLAIDADDGVVEAAELVGVAAIGTGVPSTEVEWGARGEVLRALAPTTFEQLPGVGARSLTAFAAMLRDLPTAVVRLGPDPDDVVATVRHLIRTWS